MAYEALVAGRRLSLIIAIPFIYTAIRGIIIPLWIDVLVLLPVFIFLYNLGYAIRVLEKHNIKLKDYKDWRLLYAMDSIYRADSLIEKGRWSKAKWKLLVSLESFETAEAHSKLGYVYDHEGDFARGEEHLRRAIELEPRNPKFRTNLAVHFLKQGKIEEAQGEIQEALRIDPNHKSAQQMNQYLSNLRGG